jgi:hypothetical protein
MVAIGSGAPDTQIGRIIASGPGQLLVRKALRMGGHLLKEAELHSGGNYVDSLEAVSIASQ